MKWLRRDRVLIVTYLLVLMLNTLDILTTTIGLALGAREVSPVPMQMISQIGVEALVTLKIIMGFILGLVTLSPYVSRKIALASHLLISSYYLIVILNNLQVIVLRIP